MPLRKHTAEFIIIGAVVVALAGVIALQGQPETVASVVGSATPSTAAGQREPSPASDSPTEAAATPSATATPNEAIPARVKLRNGPDGYEVTVPGWFGAPSRPHPGVISYKLGGRPFTISVGDTSGSLYVCGSSCVESTDCQSVCQPIPHPIRTLDDLQELLVSVPDPMGMKLREVHSDARLGGEPARVENLVRNGYLLGPTAYYRVFALHEGRAVVLTFDLWSTRNGTIDREEVASIVSSFHFLNDATDRVGLQSYLNRADGYRIDLPPAWIETEQRATGWTSFRTGAGTPGYRVMRVTVGSADGRISLCEHGSCGEVRVTTLEELEERVQSNPPVAWVRPEEHDLHVLPQQMAYVEKPTMGNNCLGCPFVYYNVYGFHEGRPFVIRFDYWAFQFNRIGVPRPWDLVNRIVDSFEFTG